MRYLFFLSIVLVFNVFAEDSTSVSEIDALKILKQKYVNEMNNTGVKRQIDLAVKIEEIDDEIKFIENRSRLSLLSNQPYNGNIHVAGKKLSNAGLCFLAGTILSAASTIVLINGGGDEVVIGLDIGAAFFQIVGIVSIINAGSKLSKTTGIK